MHHVMPSVCGCHFHKLYPEFAYHLAASESTRHHIGARNPQTLAPTSRHTVASCHSPSAGLRTAAPHREICRKHGVRTNTRADVSDAWRTAISRIFELSSPELTPAWATSAPEGLTQHVPVVTYFLTPAVAFLACSPLF